MRKYIILAMGILMAIYASSQTVQKWTENFEGTVSFTANPSTSWVSDVNYYLPGSSVSNPKSYLGLVPTFPGNTSILETPIYDCRNYDYVIMQFGHICKVSPMDIATIEYRTDMGTAMGPWKTLPVITYQGKSSYGYINGFNASSYSEWQPNDSTVFPSSSWWKEEVFDLVGYADRTKIQFRFVITHGQQPGTHVSYGWLIDEFRLSATYNLTYPPVVEFILPLVKDTVSSTGPWTINARVKSQTFAPIENPYLIYTATKNGIVIGNDSILMTMTVKDSLWKAIIPQFADSTNVFYYITGSDTAGNLSTASSSYFIQLRKSNISEYLYFGANDTLGSTVPGLLFSSYATNSWSRHFYLNATLAGLLPNDAVCLSSIAFKLANSSFSSRNRVLIYLKATQATSLVGDYVDPVADNATLVYDGPMNMVYPDWIELVFNRNIPFIFPSGSNLLVFVEDLSSSYAPSYSWRGESSMVLTTICSYQGSDITSLGSTPVTRFGMPGNGSAYNNSIALQTIDTKDTSAIDPILGIPVVVTVKNNGKSNLTSAVINYFVNGKDTQTVNWTGNLSSDFSKQDTIGYYIPKLKGHDTLTVWVSMPNGIEDSVSWNDMLTKAIYGSPDIFMYFVNAPTDTIEDTGPYEVIASINNILSGASVGSATLDVNMNGTTTKNETISMTFDSIENVWKATIPQTMFGTWVSYSITMGNNTTIIDSFYVYRPADGIGLGYVIIGTDTKTGFRSPINMYYKYNFSRQLYLGKEFSLYADGGLITKLAWYYDYTGSWNLTNQTCYFRAVDSTVLTAESYTDPVSDGASLVWSGSIGASASGWVEITLDAPFLLPQGKNLLVYWNNRYGNTFSSSHVFRYTETTDNYTVTGCSDNSFNEATIPSGNLFLTVNRPNARFYLTGGINENTSVAMESIESPSSISIAAIPAPVVVKIRNKGKNNLDSCIINWSLNGQLQLPHVVYRGKLAENFTDTITIGHYIPIVGHTDIIKVWVSMPNNIMDPLTYDDTLQIRSSGCAGNLAGTITIGIGGDYTTLSQCVNSICECGLTGDLTLLLKGVFDENMDMTNLTPSMNGYSLTITSLDNHPDSAVIRPASGVGITLPDIRNLTLKTITIDAAISGTIALQFTGACSNVVIRDCKLLANPTSTSASTAPVYKSSSGIVDSVFFINNLLDGGYYGFYFYGGIGYGAGQYGTNVVFDSNIVSNNYNAGTSPSYVTFTSCSYNTILSRASGSIGSIWYGLRMNYSNGPAVGNRIIQRSTTITSPYGIYSYYHNHYQTATVPNRGIIANNEVILYTTGAYHGIYAYSSRTEIINNSIYISGTGGAYGINVAYPATSMAIKNNNIVLNTPSTSACPIYIGGQLNWNTSEIDYNNYYSPAGYIGSYYYGYARDMSAWQQLVPVDLSSVNILPDFIDPSSSLALKNSIGLFCNRVLSVNTDIEGISRPSLTSMGCYEPFPGKNVNAMLTEFTGIREGSILLQSDTLKVTVYNTGFTPITLIDFGWSINDNIQTSVVVPILLSGRGQSTTVPVAEIIYAHPETMNIKVWINSVNSGVVDDNSSDDTLRTSITICSGGYSGLLTVGQDPNNNNDFPTITEAIERLRLCGLTGDVTLLVEPGIYDENIDFSNALTLLSNYTLTITSSTNKANDVIIRPSSGVGVKLGNTRNLVLKALTIDAATSGTYSIQFTEACTNIVVRDCKLLANPTAKTNLYCPVYKTTSTGIVDSIFFIHDTLDGGYYGFYFVGGTGTSTGQYGNNVVFDSNTVSNSFYYGTYPSYINFTSCSYNTILSRTDSINTTWYGLMMYYSNGPAIGNRIIQRSNAITQPIGIYSRYHNHYPTAQVQGKGLIANNEIILNTTAAYYGIYAEYSKSEVLHNSIYISGTGAARGIHIVNSANNNMVIKNNNIVLKNNSAHPVYFSATGNLSLYNIDYNNLYAPTNIGYYGSAITSMATWTQTITTDSHSVKVLPVFIDTLTGLELLTYNDSLQCPLVSVRVDKNGTVRSLNTTMGAYTQTPSGYDLMIEQISPWSVEVVENQTVQIGIDVLNMGLESITEATFKWSLNGTLQRVVSWTPTLALQSLERRNIVVDTFKITNTDTFNIVVWVETINGKQDTVHWNDTISSIAQKVPLVEFTVPFVNDTIYVRDFAINARISTITGAPVVPPEIYLSITVNESFLVYDTLPMTLKDGIWMVNIPPQYYKSKIIYSLTVSDTINNVITLIDSVYINLLSLDKTDTVVIGRGTSAYYDAPVNMSSNYSWSRQLYLYSEVCPDMSPAGTYITKIAWLSIAASAAYTNPTCYMRATDNSVETTAYIDPLLNGISQVWTGTLIILPGWVEITLDMPFFLPAGKNLEIIWHHKHGAYTNNMHTWAHTQTPNSMTVCGQNNASFPTSAGILSSYRPNIIMTKKTLFEPYQSYNLGLLSFISPTNSEQNICSPDYSTVSVILGNLGLNDYDFAKDTVGIQLEITDPHQTKYTEYVQLHTGQLASGKSDTIELMSALPVMYAGQYEVKAFLESTVDNVVYDNTLSYLYGSGRIGLPIEDDFENSILSSNFIATSPIGSETWVPCINPSLSVQPASGSGMLRYVGSYGTMSQLGIRQLDLNGSINPKLEFWYYHDSTASSLDKSYTDVNMIADGVSATLLSLFRKDTACGWKQYVIDLTPYTNNECVLIEFVATNKYGVQSEQYIDLISITSMPDLALSNVIISPELSACNLENKDLSIVIKTATNQGIDFSNSGDSIAVEVPGYSTFTVPLQGAMLGNTSKTVSIANINIPSGKNTIKAYLTSPADNYPSNDTIYYIVDIQPTLSVTVNPVTNVNSRIKIGTQVWQEVILTNTGNIELSGIELVLRIAGTNQDIVRETLPVDLAAGESYTHTFVNSYIVPKDERYQVSLIAYLRCDSANVNTGHAIDEYVDLHDLSVISIDNPPAGQPDTVGAAVKITVSLANADDINSFKNVSIYAVIENEEGQMLINRWGTIEEILPLDTQQFTFGEPYTVPEDTIYRIRVYLAKVDNYPEDDTTETIRGTIKGNVSIKEIDRADVFTLAQNIPNPANNRTRIDYNIPEAGEVVFHVHSVSGQLLYSQTIETASGKRSLELNTGTFAAGIYFYSIEYKGQRLVKRMMISD